VRFANATAKATKELDEVIDKYSIVVDDWMEKDYGLVLSTRVSEFNRSNAVSALGNIHGVTYSE
jgi:hypothetical protein